MKILLVPWALLLFGVNLNSAHYIREAEDGSPTYEVHDDPSGITFVNPKQDKPTLREILYYHIIERPRESREEPASTERSFTNSHGNQFLDLSSLLEDLYDEKDHDDNDGSYLQIDDEQHEDFGDQDTDNEEEAESTTTQKPLTDEDIKEAYKSRSYLFDQMRQRYSVKRMAVPDSLNRRKRQADMESLREVPSLASDTTSKDAYMPPKTYGMNLNSDGGYVWNNLNKPPTYYELGPSDGSPDEGSSQSQENMPPPSENAYIPPVSEPSNSGSSEDIYVVTNRPSAQPLENEAALNPEFINENPEPINENPVPINENPEPIIENPEQINDPEPSGSEANYPVQPIIGDDSKDESAGFAHPIGPEVYENPELVPAGNPEPSGPQKFEAPHEDVPANADSVEEPNGSLGYGYGQSEQESSEGEKMKEMPEAPTLPPLNYDNLPDYIRDSISSTENPASYEQTNNPYTNPQPSPEDKQTMQDKMEDMFATVQPIEDIPKTYGMNLTSGGGHVWNDMVNPPVSYEVGTPSQPEEEHKEEQSPAPAPEQPEIHEPENPLPEPAEPEKEEPIQHPGGPNQEPEEVKPVEEPEVESEKPIANPEPSTPENEDNKPIDNNNKPSEEPAEPVIAEQPGPVEPEPATESENPELVPDPGNEEVEQPSEEPGTTPEEESKKPDIMNELLKSEQFWKWLGEWTATYMELLEKHIRKIAIQEICNREKSGEQMCLLEDAPEDTGVPEDGKIIEDGKEIDMTHTGNLNIDSKRGHQNNKGDDDKKNKNENKIEASTIYGNSVGNEKVTNVFIFTADKADEVIDKLKPANKTEIDFIIDDRIKEEDEDDNNKEKSGEVHTGLEESNAEDTSATEEKPNAETQPNDKEDANNGEIIESAANEGEADKEINESEANKKANNKETSANEEASNNEESNKNESNDGEPKEKLENEEATKDPTESEANKEELNNEESNKNESGVDESKLKPSESDSK